MGSRSRFYLTYYGASIENCYWLSKYNVSPGLLPKRRIYADYLVNIAKWFDLGVAVFQDKDYDLGAGPTIVIDEETRTLPLGTGGKSTVGQLRASIKFA